MLSVGIYLQKILTPRFKQPNKLGVLKAFSYHVLIIYFHWKKTDSITKQCWCSIQSVKSFSILPQQLKQQYCLRQSTWTTQKSFYTKSINVGAQSAHYINTLMGIRSRFKPYIPSYILYIREHTYPTHTLQFILQPKSCGAVDGIRVV